ncbi:hypothetical protein KVR01_000185 [Diaporthe batatas]|uniref:uncharacterized protein n=1 Tax=Diaporthe batatas TaxID=748121 RepID=UPI001D03A660|nr:uncharacterized protein KVR01_000185 [Diaporthe batatas]KAG8169440.1 hypothetical protein KVR01_000185 [Diaporthe batatas]
MAHIFIVGGTGHTGGAVLDLLLQKHPQVQVKVLVRDETKAARLKNKYPTVQTTVGDLSSHQTLQDEARSADVVINAAPDITHGDGISAILAGLKDGSRARKGFYLHVSGAATFYTKDPNGAKEGRIWDDMADMDEILALDQSYTHIPTDNLVRAASADVHVAILAPVGIGGISPSLEHTAPLTTGPLLTTARAFGSGFQIARGENESGWVHVLDLARAMLLLIDNALDALRDASAAPAEPAGFPLWGERAYYFVRAEDIPFRDLQAALVPVLHRHGVIQSDEIRSVTHTQAARTCLAGSAEYDPDMPLPPPDSWVIHLATWFGINMRVRPARLEALGWRPAEKSILGDWEVAVCDFLRREGGA